MELDDHRRVFVKTARGEGVTSLHREFEVLQWLAGGAAAALAPRVLDLRDGDPAQLVLEDLRSALWPPPYPSDTAALFAGLEQLAGLSAPQTWPALDRWSRESVDHWRRVAADPEPFLALGVCSSAWLNRHLDTLVMSEERIRLAGDAPVHNDIYSANVCFRGGRLVLVDWAAAARGNPELDVAFAALSVQVEHARLPTRVPLADEAAWAAWIAGHNAREASAPLPAWADPESSLRVEQLGDLGVALRWAARTLGLEPPR